MIHPGAASDWDVQTAEVPFERRRHLLAFHLWSMLCEGDRLPSTEALLRDPRCTFAHLAVTVKFDAQCRGEVIAIGSGLPMPVARLPVSVGEIPGRSLVSRITEHVLEPIANRVPVGFEAEFIDDSGAEIRYRAIVLPCASDGVTIDTVVGVISFSSNTAEATDPNSASDDSSTSEPAPDSADNTEEQSSNPGPSPSIFSKSQIRRIVMSYKEKLAECMTIDGALAVALVDLSSGMALATEQGSAKGLNLEVAAAGNTNVVRAKYETMKNLGIKEDIEDILITLGSQIHMIRPATSETGKGLFIYLALDKSKANLAMARHKLRVIEKGLEV